MFSVGVEEEVGGRRQRSILRRHAARGKQKRCPAGGAREGNPVGTEKFYAEIIRKRSGRPWIRRSPDKRTRWRKKEEGERQVAGRRQEGAGLWRWGAKGEAKGGRRGGSRERVGNLVPLGECRSDVVDHEWAYQRMEKQHFVVLIDPVGRGRKTEHPREWRVSRHVRRRRAREKRGREERRRGRRREEVSAQEGRVSVVRRERGETEAEEGWKEHGERVETHILPDSYNFNHQLATPPASDGGRVICEKHVDLQEEEGQPDSFISSYISWRKTRPFFHQCRQPLLWIPINRGHMAFCGRCLVLLLWEIGILRLTALKDFMTIMECVIRPIVQVSFMISLP